MALIPKIIHQIWFQGYDSINDKNRENTETVKKFHKDWIYMFWDEKKIIDLMSKDKTTLDKYNSYIYLHQKVDFAKIVILKYYGGIYIDIDVIAVKSIDDIIIKYKEYDFIASYLNYDSILDKYISCQDTESCINNGIIMSKKNSDVCDYLINNFDDKCSYLSPKILCITTTTGPGIFTRLLKNYKGNEKILVLPYYYFEPCLFETDCKLNEETRLIHVHNLTWVDENLQVIVRNYYYYKEYLSTFVWFLILILLIYLVYIYDDKKS